MYVNISTRELDRLERSVPGLADDVVRKIAHDFKADLDDSWSAVSPSRPGQPPAVDTGTLKNSHNIIRVGDQSYKWVDGTAYGVWLEYGTVNMAARPFVAPGIDRILGRLPRDLAEQVYVDRRIDQ